VVARPPPRRRSALRPQGLLVPHVAALRQRHRLRVGKGVRASRRQRVGPGGDAVDHGSRPAGRGDGHAASAALRAGAVATAPSPRRLSSACCSCTRRAIAWWPSRCCAG
jgi:hypothetical protein